MTPALRVGTVQIPFGVLNTTSFQQHWPSSLILSSTLTLSQGFFLTLSYDGGFLSCPSKLIKSPGSLPAGGSINSTTDLSVVSPHNTIPCDSYPASFLAFRLQRTTTRESVIRSSVTYYWRPEAIFLISPFPISTSSQYNFSDSGCFQTLVIFPTRISIYAMSGTTASTTLTGCGFYYCCCLGFFSCTAGFWSTFVSFVSSFVLSFFAAFASFSCYSFCSFLSYAFDGPSAVSSGKLVKILLDCT